MTTRFSARLAVVTGVLASALVVANCNKPAPEPVPVPVVEPAPIVEAPAPPKPPVVAKTKTLTLSTPALTEKAKGLLAPGADVDIAIRGFSTPQQFMATVYAAKNLNVPFMVLKDKIVTKKMSLAAAISATSKNTVNPTLEAARAESEARADLARKSGPQ